MTQNLPENEQKFCHILYVGNRNIQVVILPTRGSLYFYIFVIEFEKLELKYKILKMLTDTIFFMSGQFLRKSNFGWHNFIQP